MSHFLQNLVALDTRNAAYHFAWFVASVASPFISQVNDPFNKLVEAVKLLITQDYLR